tara:strand:+ start:1750 stop:2307 length:558 start_codon:yes stop_codon:yes gene_type:complete
MISRRQYLIKTFYIITILFQFPKSLKAYQNQSPLPAISQSAPQFILEGSSQEEPQRNQWALTDFKGKWVIIYFYPKDFTSGCTLEARGFKRIINQLKQLNAELIGISADNIIEHKSFCSDESLNYPLLSDKKGKVSKQYGSWADPYSTRNTFLVDPSGIIRYRWIGVKPAKHAKEVLEKLNELLI